MMNVSKKMEVTIQGEYRLKGTLTIPNGDGPHPAILILAGSGQGDRDGNVKNMKLNLYKDLAKFLTEKGFVTLRYDKRGTHQSEGNFYEAGVSDFINDGVAAVQFLKNNEYVDPEKVILLGHSEGALIAPAIYNKIPVAGLILLAGAAEPSKNLLPRQSEMALKELNEAKGLKGWVFRTFKLANKIRKKNEKIYKKVAETDKPVIRVQGMKLNAKWLREMMEYNVCDYLQEVACPVLAITGEKDLQVPPDDVKRIPDLIKGEGEWHIIPDMNHIFRKYEGNHTMLGLLKEYKTQLNDPVDSELLEKMETWLEKHF